MEQSGSSNRSRYLQVLLASTALVSAGGIQAKQEDKKNSDQSSKPMEEVVVQGVARKFRPDDQSSATGLNLTLVETPQAVTVLTPEMLETVNADSAYQATDLVPGVQSSGYGFGFSQIVMRGVFNLSRRINSIELNNPVTSVRSYALERTEIVRGPATAVYGVTGSFGGEINNILKKPQKERQFQFGVEGGSYNNRKVSFDVTGALNSDQTISARLVGQYQEYGLPLDIKNRDFPNYEGMVLAAITYNISDNTTVSLSHYHQHRNTDPWDGGALVQKPDGTLAMPDANPDTWYFSNPNYSNETATIEFTLAELDHTFANGWTSKSKLALHHFNEDLGYYYPFGPFGAYSLADDQIYIYSYDVERDGSELTFNESLGGDFDLFGREHQFVAALEYHKDQNPNRFLLQNSEFQGYANMDWYSDAKYDGTVPHFSDGSPFDALTHDRKDYFGVRQILLDESKDLKLSVQALFNPTDRLQVLGGVLYHHNSSDTTIPRNKGVDVTPPTVTSVGFNETVFRLGVTYDLVDYWHGIDDARVYYNYSEGFEPQNFTDASGKTVSAPQEMRQHEIGLKAEMLNGAVGGSIAVFQYKITNIEVSSSFLGSFGGFGSTVLEGSQEATGAEFQVIGEVLPGWNIQANYTYMDAQINNPNNTRSTPPRTTPRNEGAVTTTYEFIDGPLAGFRVGGTIKASGDYSFVEGTSNVNRFGTPPAAGAHTRVDLNASYKPYTGRLKNCELYLNWHNVFDKNIMVAKQGNPGYGVMYIDRERVTFGIRYTY